MKRIAQAIALLAVLAGAQHASADDFKLATKNDAGGAIVLTIEQGACPDGYFEAYATSEPGHRIDGCFKVERRDLSVWVFWPGDPPRNYPLSIFRKLGSL